MALSLINNILSNDDINYILTLPEVIDAKKTIDSQKNGSVYFSISLPKSIKNKLYANLNLNIKNIPMRWIKGDTKPHIDTCSKLFKKTNLVYLTDSPGEFLLENNSYPITKGSAFVFNEGLLHETINTGLEPRLLLGPMSEEGLSVGAFVISGPGGTSIYFRQNGSDIQYSNNKLSWNTLSSWPPLIQNTNTAAGMLTIEFITDIYITQYYYYLYCNSNNIQFGSKTLNNDGSRPKIYIDGTPMGGIAYSGFINNFNGTSGFNSIHIFNLEIKSINGSFLASNSGWLCQAYFGTSATDNYIINCYSDGEIVGNYSGGIVGSFAATGTTASLSIIGCSSSGIISGVEAGGIVGSNYNLGIGVNTGTITIQSCLSTGNITNSGGGGIVGSYGGYNGNLVVTNCYCIGEINGANSGGIVGYRPGSGGSFTITNCYSIGVIDGADFGGICGGCFADNVTITGTINNCYSYGNITGANNNAGGICGAKSAAGSGLNNITIAHCYTTGTTSPASIGYIIGGVNTIPSNCYSEFGSPGGTPGSWQDVNAKTVLTGYSLSGSVGTTWISGTDFPFLLFNEGYTPYSTTNILTNNLIRTSSAILSVGNSSNTGIITTNYFILQITGGDSGSYNSISINLTNGIISTTSATVPGVYTLYIINLDNIIFPINYSVTTYTLTITLAPTPTPTPIPNPISFRIQSVSFNQKSSFCGTRPVSSTAVGIGAIRGKGSTTRILNNCMNTNLINNTYQSCQFKIFGFK